MIPIIYLSQPFFALRAEKELIMLFWLISGRLVVTLMIKNRISLNLKKSNNHQKKCKRWKILRKNNSRKSVLFLFTNLFRKKCQKKILFSYFWKLRKSVFDQSCPAHPINKSKVGTLSVTYRAAAGVTAGLYFSFFTNVVKKVSLLLEATGFFINKLVVIFLAFAKNIYQKIIYEKYFGKIKCMCQ